MGLRTQEGYGLYCILHHSLSTFGCLENCMDCRLASTVLHERRDDCPAVRIPEVLQLSEKGKNSNTNTTVPVWHFCAQLLEGQLCLPSAAGELTLSGQQSPPQLPKCPHCSTVGPSPPLHAQPSRQLLSSHARGLRWHFFIQVHFQSFPKVVFDQGFRPRPRRSPLLLPTALCGASGDSGRPDSDVP